MGFIYVPLLNSNSLMNSRYKKYMTWFNFENCVKVQILARTFFKFRLLNTWFFISPGDTCLKNICRQKQKWRESCKTRFHTFAHSNTKLVFAETASYGTFWHPGQHLLVQSQLCEKYQNFNSTVTKSQFSDSILSWNSRKT